MELISSNKQYGGWQNVYKHRSDLCQCDMVFGLYLPPQAEKQAVPLLWYLSGLTCTHENAMVKANLQQYAAKYGLAVIYPDTSPRGDDVADDEAYDLGQGAGFYVDATEAPWAPHYQMFRYIADELPALLRSEFSERLDMSRQGITGHSMGGHGALTIAMSRPEQYQSLSAFAPIANPTKSDWGRKQLTAYLGSDEWDWAAHDATVMMETKGWKGEVLIDQGTADNFLDLLMPDSLANAMAKRRQPGVFRMQAGYDHSYFFISTFAADHMAFHAKHLGVKPRE